MALLNATKILPTLCCAAVLTACGGGSNSNNATPETEVTTPAECSTVVLDGNCLPVPSTYAFNNINEDNSVSYTGQTTRLILIDDMVRTINSVVEGGIPTANEPNTDIVGALDFFFRFDAATSGDLASTFSIDGENILPTDGSNLTYNAISSNKDLIGKIAGGDGAGNGETQRLVSDFFGWEDGLDTGALPVDLVDYFFAQLETEATDGTTPQISVNGESVPLNTVTVDAFGRDYRQLIQKFLLGSVVFSQGTTDYLQASDFAGSLTKPEGKAYTTAEHLWDEAFGYFGAARNYSAFTDQEASAKGGRDDFANSYNDANGDGLIDIRSEVNFGNSVNCAKRDLATANNPNPTNFTEEAYNAFIKGRAILNEAAKTGTLGMEAQLELNMHIDTASLVWEKCIASTVVHYINDVASDIGEYNTTNASFASLDNFKNVAKHWSEMKGFALNLQFNAQSPFRANNETLAELTTLLADMGDAPVLADGTQLGQPYEGGVTAYLGKLEFIRDTLQTTYSFDADNIANW